MASQNNFRRLSRTLCVLLCSVAFLSSILPFAALAEDGRNQTLIITAYYSPKPDQSRYIRGSYEADMKLNGRGTNGADGTPVYTGMLAAPSVYPFGTKIYIPGLGIGTVHDRGGAIQVQDGGHRVDVWMGSGDEGLARALNWGKRTVEGIVYDSDSGIEESFSFDHIPAYLPEGVLPPKLTLFPKDLSLGSVGDDVRILQKHLRGIGYFEGPETGYFGEGTTKSVFEFQKAEKIVASLDDFGAGIFGPKTRRALEKAVTQGYTAKEETPGEEKVLKKVHPLRTSKLTPGIGEKSSGNEVKRLQMVLRSLGYYSGPLTGVYDEKTVDSVLSFQKEYGVISKDSEKGAGFYGPKTHETLKGVLAERKEEIEKIKENPPPVADVIVVMENNAPGTGASASGSWRDESSDEELLRNADKMKKGHSGEVVRILQEKLIRGGYLEEGMNTGFFGDMTKSGVFSFQKDHLLVGDEESPGAGEFGPKTRDVLLKVL